MSTACNVQRLVEKIEIAISERNAQHFEHELKDLYPYLKKCGYPMPYIGMPNAEKTKNDSQWHQIHLHFLKVLRRNIRNDEFDMEQWNNDVANANQAMIRHEIVEVGNGARKTH